MLGGRAKVTIQHVSASALARLAGVPKVREVNL
jgi:hypothetical protein